LKIRNDFDVLTIDELHYPIVSVHFEGATTLEELDTYLSHFTDWLSRNTPFGIVIHRSNQHDENVDLDQAKKVHQSTVQWAKQNKSQITQSCVGMVLVGDTFESNQKAATLKGLQSVFGCPVQIVETHAQAEHWIQQQIQSNPSA
jgi:hypothetical protein